VVFCLNFLPLAHKSAIYREGSGPKRLPEGPKSATILEKELVIFELRKVLFSEKHLRELPGARPNGKAKLADDRPWPAYKQFTIPPSL
jgi:hypothetical protein